MLEFLMSFTKYYGNQLAMQPFTHECSSMHDYKKAQLTNDIGNLKHKSCQERP